MKKLFKVFLLCFLFLSFGCEKKEEVMKENFMDEVKEIMENQSYIIVDVRTKEEFLESHIEGAISIPYEEIDDSFSLSKEEVLLVYCQSGSRSKIASDKLKQLGYTVYDLGGIDSIDLPKISGENEEEYLTMILHLNMRLLPDDRVYLFEEPIDAVLDMYQFGMVTGGGTYLDEFGAPESCDVEIQIFKNQADSFVAF